MQPQAILTNPSSSAYGKRQLVCMALVALADLLIFSISPGLNLFLFAIAVATAIVLWDGKPPKLAPILGYACFVAFAALPLLEAPSIAAIVLATAAVTSISLSKAKLLPRRSSALPSVFLRFVLAIPRQFAKDFRSRVIWHRHRSSTQPIGRRLASWLLPAALASIFLLLFTAANPVIEAVLRSIDLSILLHALSIWRIGFWLAIAASTWALMRPRLIRKKAGVQNSESAANLLLDTLFDHRSLLRSLAIFNALFAVQSLMDIMYLWGGLELPDGMSHAEYAHRGAYPLLVTALLAAAFVLVAMRRGGPGDKSPLIRGLVLIWIGQNVLLCLSSILRLDLYVGVYSLTAMRVAAGIWMGLVAAGLVLILLRIVLRRSNEWLIAMNFAVLAAMLYTGAFIDFPAFIARFNVDHSAELGHQGVPLDISYLSTLGPSAIPALDVYLGSTISGDFEKRQSALQIRMQLAAQFERRPKDWRSWNYRDVRMADYLRSTTPFAR